MQDNHHKLYSFVEKLKSWECKILFNEADSKHDTPRFVDLCEKMAGRNDYYFPSRFLGLSSMMALRAEIKVAALKAGFKLSIRGSKSNKSCGKYVEYTMQCSCHHSRVYEKSPYVPVPENERKYKKHKNDNRTFTWRAANKQMKCGFTFNVHLMKQSTIHFKTDYGGNSYILLFNFFNICYFLN